MILKNAGTNRQAGNWANILVKLAGSKDVSVVGKANGGGPGAFLVYDWAVLDFVVEKLVGDAQRQ